MILSDDQLDALTEIVNIGVGKAAASLSDLIGERICLTVPALVVCDSELLTDVLAERRDALDTSVVQDFNGPIGGRAILAFSKASGIQLGQVLLGFDESPSELDLDLGEILEEVGNIVLNGVLGSIGNLVAEELVYSVPRFHPDTTVAGLIHGESEIRPSTKVVADARFEVACRNISGSLMILFEIDNIQTLLEAVSSEVVSSFETRY